MMFVIAIPSLDGRDRKALAGMQHFKRLAYPTATGGFRTAKVDFIYVTNSSGERVCDRHERSAPDQLRYIANVEIGANAPWLADELLELANRLEKEMSGEYIGPQLPEGD
ncbi:MAG TPA: hypothetical protein VGR71_11760 [Nitrospira sp.]|nr:hypothetical protein [Nitrospira sp.]